MALVSSMHGPRQDPIVLKEKGSSFKGSPWFCENPKRSGVIKLICLFPFLLPKPKYNFKILPLQSIYAGPKSSEIEMLYFSYMKIS